MLHMMLGSMKAVARTDGSQELMSTFFSTDARLVRESFRGGAVTSISWW